MTERLLRAAAHHFCLWLLALVLAAAVLYWFALAITRTVRASSNRVTFRVLRPYEKAPNEVWMQPIMPPYFTFAVKAGAMPEKGALICDWKQVDEERNGVALHFIELNCESEIKMRLTGIDFGGR